MIQRLHPGQTFTWTNPQGATHTAAVTRFLEHDHEKFPVYYLDFPLSPEDIEEEKGNLVISVHGFGFTQPYTGTLGPGGEWHFNNCPEGALFFARPDEREEIEMWFTPKD